LPRDIAERLRVEAVKFFSQPEIRKRLADQGAEVTLMGPEELSKFVADERAKYVKLAREHNVKID
jgi:tripartite-type tricarboxylate transporter receptor subunit TctC